MGEGSTSQGFYASPTEGSRRDPLQGLPVLHGSPPPVMVTTGQQPPPSPPIAVYTNQPPEYLIQGPGYPSQGPGYPNQGPGYPNQPINSTGYTANSTGYAANSTGYPGGYSQQMAMPRVVPAGQRPPPLHPPSPTPGGSRLERIRQWFHQNSTIIGIVITLIFLGLTVVLLVVMLTGRDKVGKDDTSDPSTKEVKEFAEGLRVKDKPAIPWEAIAGLKDAKDALQEAAIWPLKKPELFVGLREAPRGILLYGPPGTGKTMLAKALAHSAGVPFLTASVSNIMGKWVGESERNMRKVFLAALEEAPCIIFLDEIDALTGHRGTSDSSGTSHKVLTEFLHNMDGMSRDDVKDKRFFVIAATNTPEMIDEAVLRRFGRRIYIGLPDAAQRSQQLKYELETKGRMHLDEEDYDAVNALLTGYSGSDITTLVREAAMYGVREEYRRQDGRWQDITRIRDITRQDLLLAQRSTPPSVTQASLARIDRWRHQIATPGTDVNTRNRRTEIMQQLQQLQTELLMLPASPEE